jgi:hypothetical protein
MNYFYYVDTAVLGMLFKFNELDGWIEKLSVRPGTRTPHGGRVRRPDYHVLLYREPV